MSLSIDCTACGAHFKVPDAIYERRIKGRVATLLCKKCKQPIEVDGRAAGPPADEAQLSAAEPEKPEPKPEVEPVPPEPEVKPVPREPEVEPPKRPEPEVEPPKPDQPEIEPPPDKPEITPERPSPEQPAPGEPAKPRATAYRPRQASEPRRMELKLPASPKPPLATPVARPAPSAARAASAPLPRTPAVQLKPRAAVRATPPAVRQPPKPRAKLEPRSVPPPPSPPSERPPARVERAVAPESVAPISVDVEVDLASVPPAAAAVEPVAESARASEPRAPAPAATLAEPAIAREAPPPKPAPKKRVPRLDETPATAVAVADEVAPFGRRRTGTRTFVVSFVIGAVIAAVALLVWRQNRTPAPSEPERVASPPPPAASSELRTRASTRAASHGSEPSAPQAVDSADVKRTLAQTADSASRCRQAESQAGNAYVALIVAPTGDIVSARVTNAPFEGTPTATCIEAVFRKLKLAPFSGAAQTLHQTVRVR